MIRAIKHKHEKHQRHQLDQLHQWDQASIQDIHQVKKRRRPVHILRNLHLLRCTTRIVYYLVIALVLGTVLCTMLVSTFQWKYIKSDGGATAFGEQDDFLIGKSCFLRRNPVMFWRYHWLCKDCGRDDNDNHRGNRHSNKNSNTRRATSWDQCQTMKPVGKCQPFQFQQFDTPLPESSTIHDLTSKIPLPIRQLTTFGVGKPYRVAYIQPDCRQLSNGICFDLSTCADVANTVNTVNADDDKLSLLRVYAYPGVAAMELTQMMISQATLHNKMIARVANPNQACILLVHYGDISSAKSQPSWNGGKNHFVYGVTGQHNITTDKSFGEVHLGSAIVGSSAGTVGDIRSGFDIPLPLAPQWKPTDDMKQKTQKRLLLSFKGSVQNTIQPYYQDRWLAAEYWPPYSPESDTDIDVQCKHKTLLGNRITSAQYRNMSSEHFSDLLYDSTFVFCPGGSGVGSYRFTEALSAGAIPVILPDLPMPWSPEIDWEACIVRVSRARIVDIPQILRDMSKLEVRSKQEACRRLYQSTIVGISGQSQLLPTSLKVLTFRIQKALEMRDFGKQFVGN